MLRQKQKTRGAPKSKETPRGEKVKSSEMPVQTPKNKNNKLGRKTPMSEPANKKKKVSNGESVKEKLGFKGVGQTPKSKAVVPKKTAMSEPPQKKKKMSMGPAGDAETPQRRKEKIVQPPVMQLSAKKGNVQKMPMPKGKDSGKKFKGVKVSDLDVEEEDYEDDSEDDEEEEDSEDESMDEDSDEDVDLEDSDDDDDDDDLEDSDDDDADEDDEDEEEDDSDEDEEDESEEEEKVQKKVQPKAGEKRKAKEMSTTKVEEPPKLTKKEKRREKKKQKKAEKGGKKEEVKVEVDMTDPAVLALIEKDKRTLFVKNLKKEDYSLLSKENIGIRLRCKKKRKGVDWYAYLEFKNEATADRNYKAIRGKVIDGQEVYVDYCGDKSVTDKQRKDKYKKIPPIHGKVLFVSGPFVSESLLKEKFPGAQQYSIPKKSRRTKAIKYGFVTYTTEALAQKALTEHKKKKDTDYFVDFSYTTQKTDEEVVKKGKAKQEKKTGEKSRVLKTTKVLKQEEEESSDESEDEEEGGEMAGLEEDVEDDEEEDNDDEEEDDDEEDDDDDDDDDE